LIRILSLVCMLMVLLFNSNPMRKIPQEISNYIDIAIEKQRVIFSTQMDEKIEGQRTIFNGDMNKKLHEVHAQFNKDMEHNNGALMEGFRHEIQLISELVKEKPSYEDVQVTIREEIHPIHTKLDVVIDELSGLRIDFEDHMKMLH
jgi:hypothetical protein